jgi:WD40 repeat protein
MTLELPARPTQIHFSADGNRLQAQCADDNIRTIDIATGKILHTVEHKRATLHSVGALTEYDPAGTRLWDLTTNRQTQVFYGGQATTVAVSPDGAMAAFSDPKSQELRLVSSRGKQTLPEGVGASDLTFSPDGQTLVAANQDNDVRVYATRNGELLRKIETFTGAMFATAFTPDGKFLLLAGLDRKVYVLDAKTWREVRRLEGHTEVIAAMSISPDGRTVITGGFDTTAVRRPVKLALWNLDSGKLLRTMPSAHAVIAIAFSPDSKRFAYTNGENAIHVMDL